MYKTNSTAKTTTKALASIFHQFLQPEMLMMDGGTHFNDHEVQELCKKWGTRHIVTAAYTPWVNGLVEGMNKLLIYILARLCTPEMGKEE